MSKQCHDIRNLVRESSGRWPTLARQLSDKSKEETAILPRSAAFYRAQIQAGKVWALFNRDDVMIGAASLLHLSDTVAELSGGWIEPDYRGLGLYSELKSTVIQAAHDQHLSLVSTTKINTRHAPKLISTNILNGLTPTAFSDLARRDPDAFKACCCCSDTRNHHHCDLRDTVCILSMTTASPGNLYELMRYFSTHHWRNIQFVQSARPQIYNNLIKRLIPG